MIAMVSGTVAVRRGDHVVVDCGGVGYRLAVSAEDAFRSVDGAGEGLASKALAMLTAGVIVKPPAQSPSRSGPRR